MDGGLHKTAKNATKVEGGVVLSQAGSMQFRFSDVPVEGPIKIRIKAGAISGKSWLPRLHVELGNDAGNSAVFVDKYVEVGELYTK